MGNVYCVLDENGTITSMIIAEDPNVLPGMVLYESYEGAEVGEKYAPPHVPTTEEIAQQAEEEAAQAKTMAMEIGIEQTNLQLEQIEQGQFATELQLQMMEANANV